MAQKEFRIVYYLFFLIFIYFIFAGILYLKKNIIVDIIFSLKYTYIEYFAFKLAIYILYCDLYSILSIYLLSFKYTNNFKFLFLLIRKEKNFQFFESQHQYPLQKIQFFVEIINKLFNSTAIDSRYIIFRRLFTIFELAFLLNYKTIYIV